jgi:arginine decarboxylase
VPVNIANDLDELLDDASGMERLSFDRRVNNLIEYLQPMPYFSHFHDRLRQDGVTSEGDIRSTFFLRSCLRRVMPIA